MQGKCLNAGPDCFRRRGSISAFFLRPAEAMKPSSTSYRFVASQFFWLMATLDVVVFIAIELWIYSKRGLNALLTPADVRRRQMSSACRRTWNGARQAPPSPVPIVAVRWLTRRTAPLMLRPSRSSKVTVSPR